MKKRQTRSSFEDESERVNPQNKNTDRDNLLRNRRNNYSQVKFYHKILQRKPIYSKDGANDYISTKNANNIHFQQNTYEKINNDHVWNDAGKSWTPKQIMQRRNNMTDTVSFFSNSIVRRSVERQELKKLQDVTPVHNYLWNNPSTNQRQYSPKGRIPTTPMTKKPPPDSRTKRTSKKLLSVVVIIPGQGYDWGSAQKFDASALSALGHLVVVTFNYRLGTLGKFHKVL